MNTKKLIAIGVAGILTPTVGAWANSCLGDACPAFTAGNVLAPAIPTILSTVTTLIAFLLNPKK